MNVSSKDYLVAVVLDPAVWEHHLHHAVLKQQLDEILVDRHLKITSVVIHGIFKKLLII